MKIDELKQGDVLLFSGDKKSMISKAIMWLTDSPVSHAALSYTDTAHIVEETPPAVRISEAKKHFKKRDVYVMRLEDFETGGVVEAATKYLNDQEPYAKSNLFMVGLLLIYRKFTPSTLTQKVIIKIMKKLTSGIIDYIDKHIYPGKMPMVCSQFVYQCYKDAGHKLNIKGGILMKAAAEGKVRGSILDQVTDRIKSDSTYKMATLLPEGKPARVAAVPRQSDEALIEELLAALQKDEDEATELDMDFVMSVHEFGHALYTHQAGTREMLTAPADLTAGLELLKENEAYFVTPGDLLDHCSDLKRKGTIKIA